MQMFWGSVCWWPAMTTDYDLLTGPRGCITRLGVTGLPSIWMIIARQDNCFGVLKGGADWSPSLPYSSSPFGKREQEMGFSILGNQYPSPGSGRRNGIREMGTVKKRTSRNKRKQKKKKKKKKNLKNRDGQLPLPVENRVESSVIRREIKVQSLPGKEWAHSDGNSDVEPAGVWAGLGSVVPDPNIKLGSVVSRVETFGPSSFFHGGSIGQEGLVVHEFLVQRLGTPPALLTITGNIVAGGHHSWEVGTSSGLNEQQKKVPGLGSRSPLADTPCALGQSSATSRTKIEVDQVYKNRE
ncbi:hypothetical protein ASPNIDRAFT_39517 [Aspergillus niger ATCC 1015]|uniref:Uncharacterized protein n=1 Tax=Aspergillus niger (strain ATCC 1015 / CBS 113.46 / FGSC A1144 / LSHB Ac4 / NCTC 3858a / NRRL 328 / USDA 3528.7) TaxID=380704 RepID=G3YC10_ASPNA|nr:hypothetical protein ASPNIDRAFT_39517 [Aspergillus niger ATCC 1015]